MARGNSASSLPADVRAARIALVVAVLGLLLIGFVMVYSTTSVELINDGKDPLSDLASQVEFALIGIVCVVVLWKLIPHTAWCTRAVWVIWLIAVALLALTALMGTELYGAKRWLQLGPIGLQPSEFVKIALLLMAVRVLYDLRAGSIEAKAAGIQALIFVLAPLVFMYKSQSDLGTTLICAVGILAVMWIGGVSTRFMIALCVAGIVVVLVSIFGVGYRADRMVYLDPWNDGQDGYGTGYNIIRSYYAIAEGGLFGVGVGNSHERFQYLFGSESDFIFAIVCEELGMLGALLVIGLFLVILVSGMRIAANAPDDLGKMIAAGCSIMLVAQAFLNIGCAIGVLPTTGKPLPFISSGGTSLVASMIIVGLILSVSNAASDSSVYERRRADLRVVRATSTSSSSRVSRDHLDDESRNPSRSGVDADRGGERPRARGAGGASSRSGSGSRRFDSYERIEMPRRSRR